MSIAEAVKAIDSPTKSVAAFFEKVAAAIEGGELLGNSHVSPRLAEPVNPPNRTIRFLSVS